MLIAFLMLVAFWIGVFLGFQGANSFSDDWAVGTLNGLAFATAIFILIATIRGVL